MTYCRKSKEYPLTGKGDINTYAVFAELGHNIVSPNGRVGLLVPSGIASDKTTMADACGFTSGSFKAEYGGKLNKWDPKERAELMAQVDAAYFILYGIDRDDAAYILSTFSGTDKMTPLVAGSSTVGEHVLDTYDYLKAQMQG